MDFSTNVSEEIVRLLLNHGASTRVRERTHSMDALMIAVVRKDSAMVECLLQHRLNPNNFTMDGKNTMRLAVEAGNAQSIRLLLKSKAMDLPSDGIALTGLQFACREGMEDVTMQIVTAGCGDPTRYEGGERCALEYAVRYGHYGLVTKLIDVLKDRCPGARERSQPADFNSVGAADNDRQVLPEYPVGAKVPVESHEAMDICNSLGCADAREDDRLAQGFDTRSDADYNPRSAYVDHHRRKESQFRNDVLRTDSSYTISQRSAQSVPFDPDSAHPRRTERCLPVKTVSNQPSLHRGGFVSNTPVPYNVHDDGRGRDRYLMSASKCAPQSLENSNGNTRGAANEGSACMHQAHAWCKNCANPHQLLQNQIPPKKPSSIQLHRGGNVKAARKRAYDVNGSEGSNNHVIQKKKTLKYSGGMSIPKLPM